MCESFFWKPNNSWQLAKYIKPIIIHHHFSDFETSGLFKKLIPSSNSAIFLALEKFHIESEESEEKYVI